MRIAIGITTTMLLASCGEKPTAFPQPAGAGVSADIPGSCGPAELLFPPRKLGTFGNGLGELVVAGADLYFEVVGTKGIHRVPLAGGEPELISLSGERYAPWGYWEYKGSLLLFLRSGARLDEEYLRFATMPLGGGPLTTVMELRDPSWDGLSYKQGFGQPFGLSGDLAYAEGTSFGMPGSDDDTVGIYLVDLATKTQTLAFKGNEKIGRVVKGGDRIFFSKGTERTFFGIPTSGGSPEPVLPGLRGEFISADDHTIYFESRRTTPADEGIYSWPSSGADPERLVLEGTSGLTGGGASIAEGHVIERSVSGANKTEYWFFPTGGGAPARVGCLTNPKHGLAASGRNVFATVTIRDGADTLGSIVRFALP